MTHEGRHFVWWGGSGGAATNGGGDGEDDGVDGSESEVFL